MTECVVNSDEVNNPALKSCVPNCAYGAVYEPSNVHATISRSGKRDGSEDSSSEQKSTAEHSREEYRDDVDHLNQRI